MSGKTRLRRLALVCGGMLFSVSVSAAEPLALQSGVTTPEQVLAQFGTPEKDDVMADGHRMISYAGAQVVAAPDRFLPYMGFTPNSPDAHQVMAVMMFGRDGKLAKYSMLKKPTGGGNGEGKVKAEDFLLPDTVLVRPSVTTSPLLR